MQQTETLEDGGAEMAALHAAILPVLAGVSVQSIAVLGAELIAIAMLRSPRQPREAGLCITAKLINHILDSYESSAANHESTGKK